MTPFLKWNGGKSNILKELEDFFPNINKINGYIEPFLGGGSVFFHIMENYDLQIPIYISDINPDLINCYIQIRDNLGQLVNQLENLQSNHNEKYFIKTRDEYYSRPIDRDTAADRAAQFIYLNKTCFNGQMRVNSQGLFNMGIGHPEKIAIYDVKNLNYLSRILNKPNVNISVISFENALKLNRDMTDYFAYFDPPYNNDIKSKSDNFVGYTKDKFHISLKMKLREVFRSLNKEGAKVMMSNSNSPSLLLEYKDFYINQIKVRRSVSAKSEYRGNVDELIITNYPINKKQKTIMEAWY